MKTVEEIQQHLDENVNNLLANHGGRVDVIKRTEASFNEHTVFVKMSGGCQGCAGAKYTLKMIVANTILAFDPTVTAVTDDTDHQAGVNPFYKE